MARLDGKVALITGAASGMGKVAAELFAREGARVLLADVTDEAGRAAADEISSAGGHAAFVHTDVSKPEELEAAVIPPSTTNVAPVTNDDSSEARNRAARAISSAWPNRPTGMWTNLRSRRAGSASSSARSGVSMGPGHSALARIPFRANSTAISRVMDSTPPLLAV